MIDIQIGQELSLVPSVGKEKGEYNLKHKCTVIYINREHHFFRVRFTYDSGSFTESYKF